MFCREFNYTSCEFYYDDVTVTLRVTLNMATLPLKAFCNEQCSVIRSVWANWDWRCYRTLHTVQT